MDRERGAPDYDARKSDDDFQPLELPEMPWQEIPLPRETSKKPKTELLEGKYLNVMEGYMRGESGWPLYRITRDVWQNFFDSNGYTLDGVRIEIEPASRDGELHRIRISSDAEYPYQRLLSIGGGYKEDRMRSAGGKHEGTRVVALHLLRDYDAQVRFGSQDWNLEFSLRELPEEHFDQKMERQRGLHATLIEQPEPMKGNFVEILTPSLELLHELPEAKDFFYHSQNPDFQMPDIDTDQGGLRFLGKEVKGNLYINGQRVSFDQRDSWNTLKGFHLWTHKTPVVEGKTFSMSRERDLVTEREVGSAIIPSIIESLEDWEEEYLLELLEPCWQTYQGSSVGDMIIIKLIKQLAERGFTKTFPEQYLACNTNDPTVRQMLRTFRHVLCDETFASIGMPKATEKLDELVTTKEVEPTRAERERIDLLQKAMEEFLLASDEGMTQHLRKMLIALGDSNPGMSGNIQEALSQRLEHKSVKMFGGSHPYLHGKYENSFIWLSRDVINGGISQAVSVYLHEITHKFGDDYSRDFSDMLTAVMVRWTEYLMKHPQWLAEVSSQWEAVSPLAEWKQVEEFDRSVQPLLEKFTLAEGVDASVERSAYITAETRENHRYDIARVSRQMVELCAREKFQGKPDVEVVEAIISEVNSHPAVKKYQEALYEYHEFDSSELRRLQRERRDLYLKQDRFDLQISACDREMSQMRTQIASMREGTAQRKQIEKKIRHYKKKQKKLNEEYEDARQNMASVQQRMPPQLQDRLQLRGEMMHAKIDGVSVELELLNNPALLVVSQCRRLLDQMVIEPEREQELRETIESLLQTTRQLQDYPGEFDPIFVRELKWVSDEIHTYPGEEYLFYARLLYRALVE